MVVHLHRVSDNVYTIYKFSDRGINAITEVAAGLAYDKYGSYSESFLKDIEKYKIDINKSYGHQTAQSKNEFLSRVFLETESWMNKNVIKIPNRCLDICESYFNSQVDSDEKEMERIQRRFERMKKAKGL
jgi:hypothetical protein